MICYVLNHSRLGLIFYVLSSFCFCKLTRKFETFLQYSVSNISGKPLYLTPGKSVPTLASFAHKLSLKLIPHSHSPLCAALLLWEIIPKGPPPIQTKPIWVLVYMVTFFWLFSGIKIFPPLDSFFL